MCVRNGFGRVPCFRIGCDSSSVIEKYRVLLGEAARLYERHEAGRPEPFNVFSVLRSDADEVNLHSRFLVALLDHRKPGDTERHNLKAFIGSVANVKKFDQGGVAVDRERHNMDILITNARRQALVIENKIWAGDQERQLQRYYDELEVLGYQDDNIHLLYLTPLGHEPSDNSRGELPKEKIKNIAYGDDNFQNWLRDCQQRAYDEPALRESIAQYLRVVQKLTGTDFSEAYMKALKELCLEKDKDHLILVHDLKIAMEEAWIDLIERLWKDIESKLRVEISDLPEQHEVSNITRECIGKLVKEHRNHSCGLYYRFRDEAQLGIELSTWDRRLFYGVQCHRDKDAYDEIREKLPERDYGKASEWWPRWRFPTTSVNPNPRDPTKEHLQLLVDDERRLAFVASVIAEVKTFWGQIKAAGLVW